MSRRYLKMGNNQRLKCEINLVVLFLAGLGPLGK